MVASRTIWDELFPRVTFETAPRSIKLNFVSIGISLLRRQKTITGTRNPVNRVSTVSVAREWTAGRAAGATVGLLPAERYPKHRVGLQVVEGPRVRRSAPEAAGFGLTGDSTGLRVRLLRI